MNHPELAPHILNFLQAEHCAWPRVWRLWLWNWYEIVNLLVSASSSPNGPYAMLSGTIYQFVPTFTVHPPLLLARKLNGHNKMAIYPVELSHTPRGTALSVSLCGPAQPHWATLRETNTFKWTQCDGPPSFCVRGLLTVQSKPVKASSYWSWRGKYAHGYMLILDNNMETTANKK